MDSDTAFIARMVALVAAPSAVQYRDIPSQKLPLGLTGAVGLLAVRADFLDKALGHHPGQGVSDHIGFDPHIHQTHNGRHGVVGMQGGEHLVPGDGGTHSDVGGFRVSGFTDHDDVRVLP